MWIKALRIPATPRITSPDVALALWAAIWIALAIAVVQNTRDVAQLGGTVSQTGAAVSDVGGVIDSIPLVPSDVSGASESVQQAGASAEVSGNDGEDAANRLGIYLGIAIAVIPSVPLIGLYLPIRFSRIREARFARRSLVMFGHDARFQEFLARRAVENLPYEEIMAVSEQPWEDMKQGRFRALAAAELDRLEIQQPLPRTHSDPP
jgi:hypothetical protein